MTLPALPGSARDQAILDAVRNGVASISWATITSSIPGYDASFSVMADALMVEGVRVGVSASLEQQIADLLGCLLLTPKLADLLWLQRTTTLAPIPLGASSAMATTAMMVKESDAIDDALDAQPTPYGLISTVGKHWVLDNDLLAHPGRAINYGWHFLGTIPGVPAESAVTPGVQVIQGKGWAHDAQHSDYSQTCILVRRPCQVNGVEEDLADVLQNASTASLASHQGVLRLLRQPGVSELSPTGPVEVEGLQRIAYRPVVQPMTRAEQVGLTAIGVATFTAGLLGGLALSRRG